MRRHLIRSTVLLLLAALGLAACASEPPENHVTLKIAAADNFLPVLRQLAEAYHRRQPWIDLELHTANTARLEEDLKQGAAFDIYIPAQPASMDALTRADAVNPLSRQLLAINQLMVIAPADSDLSPDYNEMSNPKVRQIAVANPDLLLGHLTRESLTTMHFLSNHDVTPVDQQTTPVAGGPVTPPPGLGSLEPKLLVVANEADVIAAVKDGRAQVGITYATYADGDPKIRILAPLPTDTYEPVAYYAAIPRNAPHNDEAWQFLDYLRSAEAHAIMQEAGLLVN
jgi:molybdate transport system substrate-binding protein